MIDRFIDAVRDAVAVKPDTAEQRRKDLRNPVLWVLVIAFFVFVGLVGRITGYP